MSLRDFINDNCIFRCPPGYFLKGIPAGHAYSWQFYLRKAIFHKQAGPVIAEWFAHQYSKGVQFAAMESAGPALLAAVQTYKFFDIDSTNDDLVPGFAIRKNQKEYGLLNWIEGCPEDLPVVILDDIANSKSTIKRAKEICEMNGLQVVGALTIVNKKDNDDADGLPVRSMFKISDFDLSWESYYHNRVAPDIDEFVETYKDVLLKAIEKTPEYTVLDAVSNPGLLTQFKQISTQGE